MGGGGEKKKTNRMLDTHYNSAMGDANRFNQVGYQQQQGAINAANTIQQSAFNTLNSIAQSGGWSDPALRDRYLNSIRGGGPDMSGYDKVQKLYNEFAGASGGVNAAPIREAMSAMKSISKDGGWSPERIASMDENIRAFKELGRTGGLDADAINRMRGGGVFSEFQQTGGFSPEDIANIRARANSTLPAYYDAVRQGQNRMASIQGGNPAAQSAMALRLARDQAKAMREQSLDTELGISDRIREGRQWGAEGGAMAEAALQQLLSSNKLAGLRGASDVEAAMLNSIAQNRIAASQGWTSGELGLADLIQQGRMFGTQGLESVAGARANASMAGRGNEAAGLRWLAEFEAGNRLNSAGGMIDLYNSTPGEVAMWNDDLLDNRRVRGGEVGQIIDQRIQNNPQRDWLGTIGSLVGAAGGAMTGLGNLGFGRRPAAPSK